MQSMCLNSLSEMQRPWGPGWYVGRCLYFQTWKNTTYILCVVCTIRYFILPLYNIGVIDSSGMRIWYTSSPREYDAGILTVGYSVTPHMVVPPNDKNFTITGFVHEECTNRVNLIIKHVFHGDLLYFIFLQFFPEDGIHVFANMFHTHLVGKYYHTLRTV